jgi:hypothetical protein
MQRFRFKPKGGTPLELDACEHCGYVWFENELQRVPGLKAENLEATQPKASERESEALIHKLADFFDVDRDGLIDR